MESRAEVLGVELELLCRLMEGLPLRDHAVQLLRALLDDGRAPTRRAAVATLSSWIVRRIEAAGLQSVSTALLRQLLQIARQRQGDALTARKALPVLLAVAPEEREAMILDRLAPIDVGGDGVYGELRRSMSGLRLRDDFLVRAEAARISQRADANIAHRAYTLARRDPSETVRCALADGLALREDVSSLVQLERLAREDPSLSVRLHARRRLSQRRGEPEPGTAPSDTIPLPSGAKGEALRTLAEELSGLSKGKTRRVQLPDECSAIDLARALVSWTEYDHGFALQPLSGGRVRVCRGELPVLRLWRVIHEARHPGPAKRQVGDHVLGRTMRGAIRVPPARMAEVSATGIPNQRVLTQAWGSWVPWLPLPEDYLDSLGVGTLRIVCSEGVTTIEAPGNWIKRLLLALWFAVVTTRLDRSRQRSLRASDAQDRYRYAGQLQRRGFHTSFETHADPHEAPPGLAHFFEDPGDSPATGPERGQIQLWSLTLPALLEGFQSLVGVRHNLPKELAIVCLVLAAIFFGRLTWFLQRTRAARRRLPLVMGGWGTRGKSGTERLKAAVFEGLGFPVLCKTTGCEAMVLHAPPGGSATELFIYRPYERATIWEHAQVLQLAARLEAPIFLWECMALRQDYVEQLQMAWTRDDLSTITNTYPDHEDIQGPTGLHVAETIASFVPRQALLLTTETQMLPVLRDQAKRRQSELCSISEEEVAALPADLLDRISYQEHPANISLVAAMAKALGLDREEAIILMADHVVPDLGALASFTPMRHLGRILEFTNGMSANERTGFLNNWQRAGFSEFDPLRQAGSYHVALLNNRRDRVPRSRIFASILVNDAPCHRCVLIGTNVEGLRSYILQALNERLRAFDPFGAGDEGVEDRLHAMARQLRLVAPGALLRATGPRLGLPPQQLEVAARALDDTMYAAPSRPLSLAEARQRLQPLAGQLNALAEHAGGVFQDLANPSAASVHPYLEAPIFHDLEDRDEGTDGLAEQWLDTAAETLAYESLHRACLGMRRQAAAPLDEESETEAALESETDDEASFWDDEDTLEMPDGDAELMAAIEVPEAKNVTVQEVLSFETERVALSDEDKRDLRRAARALYKQLFEAHLITVDDSDASGDKVNDIIARCAPAGAHVRFMGMQNIKGTGLDLVYRWVHAAQPLRWTEDLAHPERSVRTAALTRLERWREWSIPACQEVLRGLDAMNPDAALSPARSAVRQTLVEELETRRELASRRAPVVSLKDRLFSWGWMVVDPFDALFRRWRSDRIWTDLAAQRISHARAARELARITDRQRGEVVSGDADLMI